MRIYFRKFSATRKNMKTFSQNCSYFNSIFAREPLYSSRESHKEDYRIYKGRNHLSFRQKDEKCHQYLQRRHKR